MTGRQCARMFLCSAALFVSLMASITLTLSPSSGCASATRDKV